MLAHQRHLFAKMGMGAENDQSERSPAESLFPFMPIHSAPSRTELAILKNGIGLFDPLGQLPFSL
jgi:hypothetical protein